MSLYGRSMCVVAHAAAIEHGRLVSMCLGKAILSMAIETATFEDKPLTPIQGVALGALHVRNRRMLVKRLKGRGRIRTNKEMHFLLAALPHKNQRVHARGGLHAGVKHVWKGPFGFDEGPVHLKFSRRCGGDQINPSAFMG